MSVSPSWSHLPAVHCWGCLLEEGAVCSSGAGSVMVLPARVHSLLSLTAGQRGAALLWQRSGSIVGLGTGLCICTARMRGRTLPRVQCRTFSAFPHAFTISLPRSCGLPYLVQSWSAGEWLCCSILWMDTIWGRILFLPLALKELQLETSQPQNERDCYYLGVIMSFQSEGNGSLSACSSSANAYTLRTLCMVSLSSEMDFVQ